MINLEITIPVLNEDTTLEVQIEKILEYLKGLQSKERRITLAIADNGSTDNTRVIAQDLVSRYSNILRLVIIDRRGVGLALQNAWRSSNADIVGYMDLDLATDIKHLNNVIELFENNEAQLVYGTRLHRKSIVKGRTFKREITSRIFNSILKAYLSVQFSDGMCGFKFIYKDNAIDIIERGANSEGWFFCTEMLVVAEKINLKLSELPVTWVDDENSKVKIIPLAIEYIKAMKRIKHNV